MNRLTTIILILIVINVIMDGIHESKVTAGMGCAMCKIKCVFQGKKVDTCEAPPKCTCKKG
uniref:Potassium channel blocker pMeKTx19-1 n=1 Tax=Mesobuthus eupeus TaxID=34648 RepID=A0A088DB45_MESEU|nr:potassium channel blocker pMeKTx19-1 [Mesobuthus eupeus]